MKIIIRVWDMIMTKFGDTIMIRIIVRIRVMTRVRIKFWVIPEEHGVFEGIIRLGFTFFLPRFYLKHTRKILKIQKVRLQLKTYNYSKTHKVYKNCPKIKIFF